MFRVFQDIFVYLLAVVKEMMQYGEIAPRKEYAVTLVISLQVGLLHAHIFKENYDFTFHTQKDLFN